MRVGALSKLISLVGSMCLAGCASAHERFGDVARYAPDYGAYVIGDPKAPTLLYDPITASKVRCQEDLERVAPTLAVALEDHAHDLDWHDRSKILLAPIAVTAKVAEEVGFGMILPAVAIVQSFISSVRRDVYVSAREAFAKGRYEEARDDFRAIVFAWNDDSPYDPMPPEFVDLSLYYLGVCDDILHDDHAAADALDRFVATARWRGEAPYRDAEVRLARLDPKRVPPCRGQADVRFTWRSAS